MEHGWTAFLSEQAGAEIFDGLPKESVARTRRRKMWMRQMYAVAEMEEALGYGAVGMCICIRMVGQAPHTNSLYQTGRRVSRTRSMRKMTSQVLLGN